MYVCVYIYVYVLVLSFVIFWSPSELQVIALPSTKLFKNSMDAFPKVIFLRERVNAYKQSKQLCTRVHN